MKNTLEEREERENNKKIKVEDLTSSTNYISLSSHNKNNDDLRSSNVQYNQNNYPQNINNGNQLLGSSNFISLNGEYDGSINNNSLSMGNIDFSQYEGNFASNNQSTNENNQEETTQSQNELLVSQSLSSLNETIQMEEKNKLESNKNQNVQHNPFMGRETGIISSTNSFDFGSTPIFNNTDNSNNSNQQTHHYHQQPSIQHHQKPPIQHPQQQYIQQQHYPNINQPVNHPPTNILAQGGEINLNSNLNNTYYQSYNNPNTQNYNNPNFNTIHHQPNFPQQYPQNQRAIPQNVTIQSNPQNSFLLQVNSSQQGANHVKLFFSSVKEKFEKCKEYERTHENFCKLEGNQSMPHFTQLRNKEM